MNKGNWKHGFAQVGKVTSEFRAWQAMRKRCYDPKDLSYARYGARGIAVCPEWRASFEAFIQHIGPKPSPLHTLDRIDVNGNYEPGNVRWATPKQQARNRRYNRMVTRDGATRPLAEWCELLGINVSRVNNRIVRGWPESKWFLPPQPGNNQKGFTGRASA